MQALRNPKKKPNFLKAMKKRTRSFSYKLLVNNCISTLVYCLLYALNSIYLLLLPLGVLIDIRRINSNKARAQLNYV